MTSELRNCPIIPKGCDYSNKSANMQPLSFEGFSGSYLCVQPTAPRRYVFDVTSVGKRPSPWTCNSVKVEIKSHLECKLHSPCAQPISYPEPWMSYAHARRNQFDFVGQARKTSKALGTRLGAHNLWKSSLWLCWFCTVSPVIAW